MSEQEICAHCGKSGKMPLALRTPEGEDKPLCQICANRWLLSDEEWPKTEAKTSIQTTIEIAE